MSNIELKKQKFEKLLDGWKHLEPYCQIEVTGLDEDTQYFHPRFILDKNTYIYSQGDINNSNIYALRFSTESDGKIISTEIYEELLENIIIGYSTNREKVVLALTTLNKVNHHIRQLQGYATDYIIQILIGNSVKEITNSLINELKTTNAVIEVMEKHKSKINE